MAACRRQIVEREGPRRFVGQLGEARAAACRLLRGGFVGGLDAGAFGRGLLLTPAGGGLVLQAGAFGRFGACAFCDRLTVGFFACRALELGGIGRRRRGNRGRRRGGRCCGRFLLGRLRSLRRAFVHLPHDRPRALGRALVLRPRRDLIELGAVGNPLDRRCGGILELAVERHAQDFGVVLQRLERRAPHGLVLGMPRNRPEHVAVGHAGQRAQRRRFARRALRDDDERLGVDERVDGGEALRLAGAFERFERDVAQHGDRLRPHAFIRIVARHGGQRRRIHQLRDGGAAHARIGVLARDLGQQLPLVERNLLNEGQAHGGVGVFVTGLGAESIEQCHIRSSLTALSRRSACEIGQLRGDIGAVRRCADLLVNIENAAVGADVKRPARRVSARREHAIRPRHVLGRVAQNRVIDPERRREPRVRLRRVHARPEIPDVEPPQRLAARSERPALGRSTAGKCLRKPRDHDRTARQVL